MAVCGMSVLPATQSSFQNLLCFARGCTILHFITHCRLIFIVLTITQGEVTVMEEHNIDRKARDSIICLTKLPAGWHGAGLCFCKARLELHFLWGELSSACV